MRRNILHTFFFFKWHFENECLVVFQRAGNKDISKNAIQPKPCVFSPVVDTSIVKFKDDHWACVKFAKYRNLFMKIRPVIS